MTRAFRRNGTDVKTIVIGSGDPDRLARRNLASSGQKRGPLLTVREWEADAYQQASLAYDLRLAVLDRNGAVLAEQTAQGNETLPARATESPGQAVRIACRKALDALLSKADIRKALQ
ncbi:hypothetical protein [Xylophilus sp. GOD-11R]|uniref:hypothetical protein n=1 Tax=Xylophilus sp. GOD-11R TaxID=3089814 RepID=UPI00298CA9CB|nr:hypothetical protein [Xylophilus sp. GOD-11R]WPB56619.1 hypothetical protein R9X41_21155 [Xylophilus sp. GOD-11R]